MQSQIKMEFLSPFFTLVLLSLRPKTSCLLPPFQKSKVCTGEDVLRIESSHVAPTSMYFLRLFFLSFSGEKGNESGPVTVADIQVLFFAETYI